MEEQVGDPNAGPGVIEANGDEDTWHAIKDDMTDDECLEEEAEATAMENTLSAAGAHREATKEFGKSIMPSTVPANFVELYG